MIRSGIVIKNAIDICKFKYNEEYRKEIRREFGVNEDEVLIGTVGRMEKQKNHKYLIEIFKKLSDSNLKLKLVIVGDGSLRKELEKQIYSSNISNKVILAGSRSDVYKILSAMDMFVLPSIHEGLGIVLVEAQSNGLICFAPEKIVPEEAKVLKSFKFMPAPTTKYLDFWVSEIEKVNFYDRSKNVFHELKESGYDSDNFCTVLENLYTNKL